MLGPSPTLGREEEGSTDLHSGSAEVECGADVGTGRYPARRDDGPSPRHVGDELGEWD